MIVEFFLLLVLSAVFFVVVVIIINRASIFNIIYIELLQHVSSLFYLWVLFFVLEQLIYLFAHTSSLPPGPACSAYIGLYKYVQL